jgi:hypothetical protein
MSARSFTVRDVSLTAIRDSDYDLGIFCAGYESRSSFVFETLTAKRCHKVATFTFKAHADHPVSQLTVAKFRRDPKVELIPQDARGEFAIIEVMNSVRPRNGHLRVLIDYSSMPRRWFTLPLLWALHNPLVHVEFDYVYALGEHQADFPPDEIDEILCLPGCEGRQAAARKSVAVFGLGFEGVSLGTAYNMLEVDQLFAFVCSPGSFPGYDDRALKANDHLIESVEKGNVWRLPLRSVEDTYRFLAEFAADAVRKTNVCFLPVGPKPGVLACTLTAFRIPAASCLQLTLGSSRARLVAANGEIVSTRIGFLE